VWLTGMPCCHVVAAIAHTNGRPETLYHGWLIMESCRKTYACHVEIVEGDEYCAETNQITPLPPTQKKTRGRSKKARRKDPNVEPLNPQSKKLKRKLAPFKC